MRDENPSISHVFTNLKAAKPYFKLIGTAILQSLFIGLWSLLLIVPGIIKWFAYSQTYYVLRDHPELTATEAITESRKLMSGYKWKYFLLLFSFIGWATLCIFTLGIGLLWLAPYITASNAAFYNQIVQAQEEKR